MMGLGACVECFPTAADIVTGRPVPAQPVGLEYNDRGDDLRLLVTAWGCQAATWYS
jgi:hypothetical protein